MFQFPGFAPSHRAKRDARVWVFSMGMRERRDASLTMVPAAPWSPHTHTRPSYSHRVPHDATAPTPCKRSVSDLFHSPLGVLFTFPSRYWSTIGLEMYLALPVSAGRFTQAIRVPRYSGITTTEMRWISRTGLLPSAVSLPSEFHYPLIL